MSESKKSGFLSKSLGACTGYKATADRIILATAEGKVEVIVYTPEIIRVRICPKGIAVNEHSYAVINQQQKVKFSVKETAANIKLQTSAVKLVIDKAAVRFSFYTLDGKLINADDKSFGSSVIGTEVTTYKALQADERFIGLGEKTGNLDRKGTAHTNWNTDKFGYAVDADPIYMSIPFYMGLHNQLCYGIFFDNTFKTKFNFGASNNRFASFSAEGGDMNYYFIYGKHVSGIIENYTWLTGRMEMPPLWSLGLQQCRYSYYPDTEVLNVARTFREKKIPADVIYLDIHYMDSYKVFTFHPERFADPLKMTNELRAQGFKTIVILDPGIKVEKGYKVYDEGVAKDYFVKYPNGENYSGEVWPGWSHFPDFTNPEVRNWWAEKIKFYKDNGIDGYWNDMNEPAAWGQSPPDLIEFDYDGHKTSHKQAHNVYGMQMARSTHMGAKQTQKDLRPFTLNRAGYSGIQRYTASWTGDNIASDEHMLCGVRLVNSLGLSGVAFAGYDVGGFAGEAAPGLFAKWIVLGAFSPLFRCHSMINSKDAEPWAFGEETEEISRNYIGLRYRLLPYIYSTFFESTQNGMPVARSLAIQHAFDEKVYEPRYQNQYYFGQAFLVPPVESCKEFAKIYLPESNWYDLHSGKSFTSGEHIIEMRAERFPLFVKGSSIIPMQSLVQSTVEQPDEVLELHIYKGEEPNAFVYYEDDGTSNEHEKGVYFKRTISYHPEQKTLTLSKKEGGAGSKFKTIKLYLHSFSKSLKLKVNNAPVKAFSGDYQFIAPVSSFDPFYTASSEDMIEKNVAFTTIENAHHEIKITW
jgi:alpha-glucosidase